MQICRFTELDPLKTSADLFSLFIENAGYEKLGKERQKYMYRYLVEEYYLRFPELFYLCVKDSKVLAYLCFCPDTLAALSSWIPFDYYRVFNDYYKEIPAHLHINVEAKYRGQKIGAKLLSYAKKDIKDPFSAISVEEAANARFYEKNGFIKKSLRPFKQESLVLWSSY